MQDKMIPKLTEHLEKARMKGAKEWLKILLNLCTFKTPII